MSRIKFAIIGSGWRSEFFVRIAQALPERLELSCVVVRNEQKAQYFHKTYNIPVLFSLEQAAALKPDFIVVCVSKPNIFDVIKQCVKLGLPVLSETPPALAVSELAELWQLKCKQNAKIQVAEQYHLMPLYSAKFNIVQQGFIGEPYTIMISDAHDYHAVSLIRKFLNCGFENVRINGQCFDYTLIETGSRVGVHKSGKMQTASRYVISFEFESGKRAFYDFSGVQYHSRIRSRHFCVQGIRGEIFDNTLLWTDSNNVPQKDYLKQHINADGRSVLKLNNAIFDINPYASVSLNDDESAIMRCIEGMHKYLCEGLEFYKLEDALQDTYISLLMHKAVQESKEICSKKQVWS